MPFNYPYSPITGKGLGTSYSSLAQIGSIYPHKGNGQANVQIFANATNGNLHVRDVMTTFQEANAPITLGYVYNSQAATPSSLWQLTHKKFVQLPNGATPGILQEEDGHLTTYLPSSNVNVYAAPACGDGIPFITFDETNQYWDWYHPATQMTECYSTQGLLLARIDKEGRATQYQYDSNNELETITGPTGNQYKIIRQNNGSTLSVAICEVFPDTNKVIQSYTFNTAGYLQNSQTASGYEVNYGYSSSGTGNFLYVITQSDNTKINLSSDDQGRTYQIATAYDNSFITYPTPYQPFTRLRDGNGIYTDIYLDTNGRAQQINQQTGYDIIGTEVDTTYYSYTAAGQLQTQTNPDLGIIAYEYDPLYGNITKKTEPNGQTTQYYYHRPQPCFPASKVQLLGQQQLIEYYVYDTTYNGDNLFLCFVISPQGRVTEFRPDAQGNIASKRVYLTNFFNVSTLQPQAPVGLFEMQDWIQQQNPQQVSLTEYLYDNHGLPLRTTEYANVDSNGNGILDSFANVVSTEYDEFGNLLQKITTQTATTTAMTEQRFDSLQRLINVVDPLQQVTQYNFSDSQSLVQMVAPNGSTTTKQYNAAGITSGISQTATNADGQLETRNTFLGLDTLGQICQITRPDGQVEYQFYDNQNRLGLTVSPTGLIECTQYTRTPVRTQITTRYNSAITYNQLFPLGPPPPGIYPLASTILDFIDSNSNPTLDRARYEIFDDSGRAAYSVDGNQFLTQTFYDALDRPTAKVTYSTALTAVQISQLTTTGGITVMPDFTKDRCHRYFYDNDNLPIGEQDEAGYVTQFIRDAGGRVSQTIRYATTVALNMSIQNFAQIIPPANPQKDAYTYCFYDARGQKLVEVDAESTYTQNSYFPNGKINQSIKYANPVDPNWMSNPVGNPPVPASNSEDQTTTYAYDLLERPVQTVSPYQKSATQTFDVMGNVTQAQTQDLLNSTSIDPSCQRSTQAQYDGWNQTIAEANPMVSQLITAINANSNLTPAQKQAAIQQVWQTQSTRKKFDFTGLELITTDPLGNAYITYYNAERKPVLTINSIGQVKQLTYNSFKEVVSVYEVYTQLSVATVVTLTGGFITADVQALVDNIKNTAVDKVTNLQYDNRGQVNSITDPEGYNTTKQYNAFKQIDTEVLPVNSTNPTLTIKHTYEPRGLETQTSQTAGGITITTSSAYNDLNGKRTLFTDANLGNYAYSFDRLGRNKTFTDPLQNTTHTFTLDAFGRVLTDTDSLGDVTVTLYNQQDRTQTVNYPVNGVKRTTTLNIFNEKIQVTDGLGSTETWAYAANGLVVNHTNPLGNTTQDTYDLVGNHWTHVDERNVVTAWAYNIASQCTSRTDDLGRLNLLTTYQPDAFGNNEWVLDPRNIQVKNSYDRRGLLSESVRDPGGLNLITNESFNGQQILDSLIRGDNVTPSLYTETYQMDGFNRQIGKTIDPENLNITSSMALDGNSNCVKETDPNGNIKRIFYNGNNKPRFTVDARGGVYEQNYDSENRPSYERYYDTAIDPTALNDNSKITDVIALLEPNDQDAYSAYYYDNNGNLRFTVNSQGIVKEKRYNLADCEIQAITYDTYLSTSLLPTLTTAALISWVATNQSTKDSCVYKILDSDYQPCFIIDPNGYITQQVFDQRGQVIAKTIYANALINPAQVATLPVSQVLSKIRPNLLRDRQSYYVFDSLKRPVFEVDPLGNVKGYNYDQNGNKIQKTRFSKPIIVPSSYDPSSYDDLVVLLNNLVPNPSVDRITSKTYDNGNRVQIKTDPLGNKDIYNVCDAMGNVLTRTDRNGNQWNDRFDTANRLATETTPPVPVTTLTPVNNNSEFEAITSTIAITRKIAQDKANNKIQVTEGYSAEEPENARTLNCHFDSCNQFEGTEIDNALVDNPAANDSFEKLPVQTTTVNTTKIYNAKNKEVAAQNENGQWNFTVYDSEGREVYTVDALGFVTEKTYDTKDDVLQITSYATKLPSSFNLLQYINTGIPLNILAAAIQTSELDRTIEYTRDNRGDILLTTRNKICYFIPNEGTPSIKVYQPQTKFQYDAFRQCVFQATLTNPQDEKKGWSRELKWFDRNGNVLARCNAINAVILRSYDAYNQEVTRTEWGEKPSSIPNQTTSLAELIAAYVADPKDRSYHLAYDLIGNQRSETLCDVILQQMVFVDKGTEKNIPTLQNLPPQDLVTEKQWSPTQKLLSTTYPDGSTEYTFYDARDLAIAMTGVPRQTADGKTLVPLTYTDRDAFGQTVMTRRFYNGTSPIVNNQYPTPLALDNKRDQLEFVYMDSRGLVLLSQDADGYVTGNTYTATRKIARSWYYLINRNPENINQGKLYIDSKRFAYDALDQVILLRWLRDNTPNRSHVTASQLNAFGEMVAEGPGDGTWPLIQKLNNIGQVWFTNAEKGANTIVLTDLAGRETLRIQSADFDLSTVAYSDLPTTITNPALQLQLLQTTRDAAGRGIEKAFPTFICANPDVALDMPMSLVVGLNSDNNNNPAMSWVIPPESTAVIAGNSVIVAPTADPSKRQILPVLIPPKHGRYAVDISTLPADVYDVEINYYRLKPTGNVSTVAYITKSIVQFNTNITGGLSLVATVQGDSTLLLTGNTTNLTAVNLYQDDQLVQQIPVAKNNDQYSVDLSGYASGVYKVQPVIASVPNSSMSLPFTIYTATPAANPLSKEIATQATLLTYWNEDTQYAQLIWAVPADYAACTVNLTCTYKSTDLQSYTDTCTISPSAEPIDTFTVNNQTIVCNAIFTNQVASITDIQVALQLPTDENIIIVTTVQPSGSSGDNVSTIATNTFLPSLVLYINPLIAAADDQITYLDSSQGNLQQYKYLPIISRTQTGAVVDVTSMAQGVYKYKLSQGNVYSAKEMAEETKDVFYITQGNLVFGSKEVNVPDQATFIPKHEYGFDFWDNLTLDAMVETEDKKYNTEHAYNALNKRIQTTKPYVDVWGENGKSINKRPVTLYGFNARGFYLGYTDDNGNTEGYVLDAAGQQLTHAVGDGTLVARNTLDALGRIISRLDSRGKEYKMEHDRRNNVVQMTYPSGRKYLFDYNANNKRWRQVSPSTRVIYYDFDVLKNVSTRYLPDGTPTVMEYHYPSNELNTQTNSDGTLTWDRDYFGNANTHTDLGGAVTTYTRDLNCDMTREKAGINAQHGKSLQLTSVNTRLGTSVQAKAILTPAKDIQYILSGRLVVTVVDHSTNQRTVYGYDVFRRRNFYQLYQGPDLIRQMATYYDAHNRESYSQGPDSFLQKRYDGVDNMRCEMANIIPPGQAPITTVGWNKFDRANRCTLSNGVLNAVKGIIEATTVQGIEYAYPNQQGLRRVQIRQKGVPELLNYAEDDGVLLSGPDGSIRTYDSDLVPTGYAGGTTSLVNQYNINHFLTQSTQHTKDGKSITSYDTFNSDGLPQHQHSSFPHGISDDIHYTFALFDRELQWEMQGTRKYDGKNGPPQAAFQYVSSTGMTIGQSGVLNPINQQGESQRKSTVYLVRDNEGTVIQRIELIGIDPNNSQDFNTPAKEFRITYFFHDVNKNPVASYARYFNLQQAILRYFGAQLANSIGTALGHGGKVVPLSSKSIYDPSINASSDLNHYITQGAARNGLIAAIANVAKLRAQTNNRQGMDIVPPVSNSYPPMTANDYVVQASDTLESIAAQLSDVSYAEAIGFANSLSNDTLISGERISIPQMIAVRNQVSSAPSYSQFMDSVLLNFYPILRMPNIDEHHSFLAEVLEVAAVAAGIVVGFGIGGVIAGALSVSAGSAAATAITAGTIALTTTLTDAAAQEISVQAGWSDQFSWRKAIATGVDAGIGAAIMGGPALASAGAASFTEAAKTVAEQSLSQILLRTGAAAAAEQLAEIAIGVRKKFSIMEVASTIAAQYASMQVTGSIKIQPTEINKFAMTGVNSAVNNVVSSIFAGREPNVESMAANALGTYAGTYAGDKAASAIKTQYEAMRSKPSQTYSPAASKNATPSRANRSAAGSQYGQGSATQTTKSKQAVNAVSGRPSEYGMFGAKSNNLDASSDSILRDAHSSYSELAPKPDLLKQLGIDSGIATGQMSAADVLIDQVNAPGAVSPAERAMLAKIYDTTDQSLRLVAGMAGMLNLPFTKVVINSITSMREDARALVYGDSYYRQQAMVGVAEQAVMAVGFGVGAGLVVAGIEGTIAGASALTRYGSLWSASGDAAGSLVSQVGSIGVESSIGFNYNKTLKDVFRVPQKLQLSYDASNLNSAEALSSKLSAIQKAQSTAAKIETMLDGSIRYYLSEVPSRTLGVTRGASYVTEYNPSIGTVKSWMESYDHYGNVTRVHPKMLNGQTLNSPHFPPTARELLESQPTSIFRP